jgi:hypothetical protein
LWTQKFSNNKKEKKQARQQQKSTKDLVDSEVSISRKKKENKQDNSKDKRFKIHGYSIVIQKLKGRSIHIVKMLDMIKRKEKESYRDHVRRGVEQLTRRYET